TPGPPLPPRPPTPPSVPGCPSAPSEPAEPVVPAVPASPGAPSPPSPPASPAACPFSSLMPCSVNAPPLMTKSRTLPWPARVTLWPLLLTVAVSPLGIVIGDDSFKSGQFSPNLVVPPWATSAVSADALQEDSVLVAASAWVATTANPTPVVIVKDAVARPI